MEVKEVHTIGVTVMKKVYDAEGDAQPQRKRKSRQQQRILEFSEENDEEELTIWLSLKAWFVVR